MSGINVDPIDGSFWAVNEFTDASHNWGQAIANFTAPPVGPTVVESGATLELDGDPTGVGSSIRVSALLLLNGAGVGGAGALRNLSGNNTWVGTVTLPTDSSIGVNSSTRLAVTGTMQDPTPVPAPPPASPKSAPARWFSRPSTRTTAAP